MTSRKLHIDVAGVAEAFEILAREHDIDSREFAREGERVRAAHASGVAAGLRIAVKNLRAVLRGTVPPVWSASYPSVTTVHRDARRTKRRARTASSKHRRRA